MSKNKPKKTSLSSKLLLWFGCLPFSLLACVGLIATTGEPQESVDKGLTPEQAQRRQAKLEAHNAKARADFEAKSAERAARLEIARAEEAADRANPKPEDGPKRERYDPKRTHWYSGSIWDPPYLDAIAERSSSEPEDSLVQLAWQYGQPFMVESTRLLGPDQDGAYGLEIAFRNVSDRALSSVTFSCFPADANMQKVICNETGRHTTSLRALGGFPPEANALFTATWPCIWHNRALKSVDAGSIEVKSVDGLYASVADFSRRSDTLEQD